MNSEADDELVSYSDDLIDEEKKLEKAIYWKDIYGLVTSSKVRPTDQDIRIHLLKVRSELGVGLNHFESGAVPDVTTSKTKSGKFIDKISSILRLPRNKSSEIVSNYLTFGFRGSQGSFKEIVKNEEVKVLIDVVCFYYRERQFYLRTWYQLMSNIKGHPHSGVYNEFVGRVGITKLYHKFLDQLTVTFHKERPNNLYFSSNDGLRFTDLFLQYQMLELICLAKLLLICGLYYTPPIEHMTRIARMFSRLKKMQLGFMARRSEKRHEGQCTLLIQLLVLHFIQLTDLEDFLKSASRWEDKLKLKALNKEIITVVNLGDDCGTIFSVWILVQFLFNKEFKNEEIKDILSAKTKTVYWDYFVKILSCKEMEDALISRIAHKTLYFLVDYSVKYFGIRYSYNDSLLQLTALLVRDDYVIRDFWSQNDAIGLKMAVNEAEQRFPIESQHLLTVYINIAAIGKEDTEKLIERLNNDIGYCEECKDDMQLTTNSSEQFYECSVDYHPLEFMKEVTIPSGTKCIIVSEPKNCIYWKFTLPFWKIAHNAIKRWLFQMNNYPHQVDEDVKSAVLQYVKLITQVIKSELPYDNLMKKAIEDVYSNLNRSCDSLDVPIIENVMMCSKYILKKYAKDVIFLLEGMKIIPVFDHYNMNHIDAALGKCLNTNLIKTFLEMVEMKHGSYPVLISYLEFILEIFKIPWRRLCWTTLAGVVFVLVDVLPQMKKWIITDDEERVKLHLLSFEIIYCALKNLPVDKASLQKDFPSFDKINFPRGVEIIVPTVNFLGNVCLHSILNTDAGTTLLQFISIGEQQLFCALEKFNCWHSGCSVEIIRSLIIALNITDRVLLQQSLQTAQTNITSFESELFREPSSSHQLHVVLSIASYIYSAFDIRIRYNSLNLLTKFASNTKVSLKACLGLEAPIIRQLFLHPYYSKIESDEIKIALTDFITECIHNQPSLTETLLNASEVVELVKDNANFTDEELSGGILQIILSIVKETSHVGDIMYYACGKLLEALWRAKSFIVLSFLRIHKSFFKDFFHVIFIENVFDGEVMPLYSKIFSVLALELYYTLKSEYKMNKDLKSILKRLIQSDLILKWCKFCIEPDNRIIEESEAFYLFGRKSTFCGKEKIYYVIELMKAWNNFFAILLKLNYKIHHKDEILIHIIYTLHKETCVLNSETAIQSTSELFLTTMTNLKRVPQENIADQFSDIANIIERVSESYKMIPARSSLFIFSAVSLWLKKSVTIRFTVSKTSLKKMISAICSILVYESKLITGREANISKIHTDRMAGIFCLAKEMMKFKEDDSKIFWDHSITHEGLVYLITCATAGILKNRKHCDLSVFCLELLVELIKEYPEEVEIMDTFEFQYSIWDGLSYPESYSQSNELDLERLHTMVKSNWTPIFIQGINLAHTLLTINTDSIRQTVRDFIICHGQCLCEVLLIPTFSISQHAVELICAVFYLLNAAMVSISYKPQDLRAVLSQIIENTKVCLSEIMVWLNNPEKLNLAVKASFLGEKLPTTLAKQILVERLVKIQKGLLKAYISGINIFQTTGIHAKDLSMYRRYINYFAEEMNLYFPWLDFHDFYPIAVRFWTKVVSMNPNICGYSCDSSFANMSFQTEELSPTNTVDVSLVNPSSEDIQKLQKLSECNEMDISEAHQSTLHVVICDVFLTILLRLPEIQAKHTYVREFISEMCTYLEFQKNRLEGMPSIEEIFNKSSKLSPYLFQWAKEEYPLIYKTFKRLEWPKNQDTSTDLLGDDVLPEYDIGDELRYIPFSLEKRDAEKRQTIRKLIALLNKKGICDSGEKKEIIEINEDNWDPVTGSPDFLLKSKLELSSKGLPLSGLRKPLNASPPSDSSESEAESPPNSLQTFRLLLPISEGESSSDSSVSSDEKSSPDNTKSGPVLLGSKVKSASDTSVSSNEGSSSDNGKSGPLLLGSKLKLLSDTSVSSNEGSSSDNGNSRPVLLTPKVKSGSDSSITSSERSSSGSSVSSREESSLDSSISSSAGSSSDDVKSRPEFPTSKVKPAVDILNKSGEESSSSSDNTKSVLITSKEESPSDISLTSSEGSSSDPDMAGTSKQGADCTSKDSVKRVLFPSSSNNDGIDTKTSYMFYLFVLHLIDQISQQGEKPNIQP